MTKKIIVLCYFLCLIFSTQAQETPFKNAPLKKVLLALEKQHNVKFSFSDNLISNKTISASFYKNSLDKTLQQLQTKTGLIFQKVTNRYVIISSKNTEGKTTICGYIIDTFSQKPLVGATIITSDNVNGTTTDKSGYFQLNGISTKKQLRISYIGYKTLKISASKLIQKPCVKIQLEEYSSILDEVLIFDYLTDGFSKKADGSESISPKKLGILPGLTEPDVLQSIQLLPGVQSPNETASGLHIRGGTPDQNLVLFDGVKMYNSGHFFGMFSAINPYITENVKVYRSGASAEYGNHISGIIDIKTDEEIAEKISGGFGTNLTHLDGFLKIPVSKKLSVAVSARRSFTDIFNTPTFDKLADRVFQNTTISRNRQFTDAAFTETNNDFYFTDIYSKLVWNLSKKDKIQLGYFFNKNQLDYSFKFTDDTDATKDFLNINNNGLNLKWNRDWSKKTQQQTSIYYSKYNLKYSYNGTFDNNTISVQQAKTNTIKEVSLKSVVNWKKTETTSFKFGYEYTTNNVGFLLSLTDPSDPEFNYNITEKNTNNSHAIFSEYMYKKGRKLSLNFGLRVNYFSLTDKLFLAPRAYGQLEIASNLWAKASAEFKQQNISQIIELSTADFGLENQVWALANNNEIPLLKSNQFSFGLLFKHHNWTIDTDVYRKKINGLTSLTRGFNANNTDFSEGESLSVGLDILVKKKWQDYNTWISYSLSNTDFTFSELNNGKSFAGNFDVAHSFTWSHNLKINSFDVSLGWNFRTGIPYTEANGINADNDIVYGEINKNRLPNYNRLDISSTYNFAFDTTKKWKGKIGVSLLNITGKKNILQRNYETITDINNTVSLEKADVFSLGFTPNLVFRVSF